MSPAQSLVLLETSRFTLLTAGIAYHSKQNSSQRLLACRATPSSTPVAADTFPLQLA